MSPIRVTFRRTVGHACGLYTSALSLAGFLALTAGAFAFGLERAEGTSLSLAAVWTAATSAMLPFLDALLAMGVWSDERQSGRMDALLSVSVRERDYVLGKFLGIWVMTMGICVLSLFVTLVSLFYFAPSIVANAPMHSFVSSLLALAVQSALWSAASVALSAFFIHAAAAAASSFVLFVAVPRGVWAVLRLWSRGGSTAFGEFPLDAHALDWAQGSFSLGTVLSYFVIAIVCLLLATKAVTASRLVGRGARMLRASTMCVFVLALVFAALAVRLALRFDMPLDVPAIGLSSELSSRTRGILVESSGDISVTCFLARSDKRFRSLAHLLRMFSRASASLGGARFSIRYVDPRWDIGAAERLASRGVSDDALVFESGRRFVALPLKDGCGERIIAATVRRLTMPAQRRCIYWLTGHGSASLDGYGIYGFSDVARELVREGYRNETLDLASDASVPSDCALVVLAGPREALSRVELDRLDAYLRTGGRLFALFNSMEVGDLVSLFASWGIAPATASLVGAKTLSGSDVIASDFSDHPVVAPLKGSRVIFESPIAFAASTVASSGSGVDSIVFTPLVTLGGAALAASVERGTGAGDDLAIRPTRIIVVGDATFALNGALSSRGNANRDFFLNCVAYLAGADAMGASGCEAGVLVSGLDRAARLCFVGTTVGGVPLFVFIVLAGVTLKRRLRT